MLPCSMSPQVKDIDGSNYKIKMCCLFVINVRCEWCTFHGNQTSPLSQFTVSFFAVRAENNPVAKISIRAIIIMINLLAIVCFHIPMCKKESS